MTDTQFEKEELVQMQRALGQRRREFLNTVDKATSDAIGSAYRKVQGLLADVFLGEVVETQPEPPKPARGRPRKVKDTPQA